MHRLSVFILAYWWPVVVASAQSAPPGNEWINHRQTYYKIPVAQAGLYRVTFTELQRAGVPVDTINPTTLQLFHRGTEQTIVVAGEADRRFDMGDYLEFYGQGNDGLADSLLYRPATAQPHPYYSLFSDTTAYFLTWRPDSKPGKRMATYTDTAYARLQPDMFHWAEERRLYTDTYPGYAAGIPPKIEYSQYEPGEGHTGAIQQKDKPNEQEFALPNLYRTGPRPQLDLLLVGRDYTAHRVECRVGPTPNPQRLLRAVTFNLYDNAHRQDTLSQADVSADGHLWVSTVSTGNGSGPDRYSVSYLRLRYPQTFTAGMQPLYTFRLAPNPVGRSLLTVGDIPPNARFFDITDPTAPVQIGATGSGTTARLIVRGTDQERRILCVGPVQSVAAIRPVTFTDYSRRRPTYVIISHERLMQPTPDSPNAVRTYAAYRASAAGGGFDTLTVTMQQLIDQYSYGERHPLAIRRFIDQLLRQSSQSGRQPQYLLLLGRGRSAAGVRHNPAMADLDMVMTMGFPSSDAALTAGLDGFPPDVPRLPTGRVNAATPNEVMAYLNKVVEYERLPSDTPWRKDLLHLSGGSSPDEARLLRSLVDAYRDRAEGESLGARVTTLSKQTDAPTESLNVAPYVNEGVGLITFFGHSGLDVTDLDIGFCSTDALDYRNRGRYPLLLINGCAIGNFFFGRPTLTTDWVLTPERGAIAAIAQSHLGYIPTLNQYSTTFYQLLTDSTWLSRPIGQLQQETIRRVLTESPDGLPLANAQQMVLQGDPAIRLFPFQTPDYALSASGLRVTGTGGQPLTTGSDSVRIEAIVQNLGQLRSGRLPIRVRRLVNGRESGVYNLLWPRPVAYRDTLVLMLPNERGAEGINAFEVTLNPTDQRDGSPLSESNHTNNRATVEVAVPGKSVPIGPTGLPEGQLRLANPVPADIRQGDVVTIRAEFTNLGAVPFADSLVVRQTLYASALTQPQPTTFRVRPTAPGDTLRFAVTVNTAALPGLNRLFLTVNPYLQPEGSFLNNTLDLALPVQPDRLGPVLEVAFDGRRIEDGAVVSARPVIDVLVADENRALLRRDTTGLSLLLQRPGQTVFERLNWRDAPLQPAGTDNVFRIRYPSPPLPEGNYRLLVTAQDILGNPAAPYQTRFRVIHDRQLTGLTVYPNPFRDQTLFAFHLTGDQTPVDATLTISDLTGRVVRRLHSGETGRTVRVGLNEWVWDGRGDSGEPLPMGVYPYRLTITDAGQPLNGRVVLTR